MAPAVTEPDFDALEVSAGSLAGEIVVRWGGADGVEGVIDFSRKLWAADPDLFGVLWLPAPTVSVGDRQRIAAAWDEWRDRSAAG